MNRIFGGLLGTLSVLTLLGVLASYLMRHRDSTTLNESNPAASPTGDVSFESGEDFRRLMQEKDELLKKFEKLDENYARIPLTDAIDLEVKKESEP